MLSLDSQLIQSYKEVRGTYSFNFLNQAHDSKNVIIHTVKMTAGVTPQLSSLYSATKTQIIINPVAAEPNKRKLDRASKVFCIKIPHNRN
jgi:hypothetical protein